jgi:mitochondrial fission protein ELM1
MEINSGFKGLKLARYIKTWHAVVQLVEALRYKLEGRWFDFRWCHWNFLLT